MTDFISKITAEDAIELRDRIMGDKYSVMLTKAGAAILARTKSLRVMGGSSFENEAHASIKMSDVLEFQMVIDEHLGDDMTQPYLMTTDNRANQLVSEGEMSAGRAKHLLRKYIILQQRIRSGRCVMRHVESNDNPADFLTKCPGRSSTSLRSMRRTRPAPSSARRPDCAPGARNE